MKSDEVNNLNFDIYLAKTFSTTALFANHFKKYCAVPVFKETSGSFLA